MFPQRFPTYINLIITHKIQDNLLIDLSGEENSPMKMSEKKEKSVSDLNCSKAQYICFIRIKETRNNTTT